jgi:hypothetical protein
MFVATPVSTVLAAEDHYVVVTPDNLKTVFPGGETQTVLNGQTISSHRFVEGPGDPPLGEGSLELTTITYDGKQQYLEYAQYQAPISTINEMGYSTYKHPDPASVGVVVSINMEIQTDPFLTNATGYSTLVFEPYRNPQQGPVIPDTWQTWNAYLGNWWSTRPIPCAPTRSTTVSWSVIVNCNPRAFVLSYGINQGRGNASTTSNVDALKIGLANGNRWTYDFEPGCRESDGDGSFQGQRGQGNFSFDGDGCKDGDANGVSSTNRGDSKSFSSTSIGSMKFNPTTHTLTMAGLGTVAGVPVSFVFVAVETGLTTPGWVSLTFSDGYTNAGPLLSGNVLLH